MATPHEVAAFELIRQHLLDEFESSPIDQIFTDFSSDSNLNSDYHCSISSSHCDSSCSSASTFSDFSNHSTGYDLNRSISFSEIEVTKHEINDLRHEAETMGEVYEEIQYPNPRGSMVWLGTFDSAIEAAEAYDRAAFAMRGSKTILNFPLEVASLKKRDNMRTDKECRT
ncbi:hypothetical protein L1887_31893 [Cichorium endivia]|nr:hypothetical protein L1887_31893 [Cichorium endivia]